MYCLRLLPTSWCLRSFSNVSSLFCRMRSYIYLSKCVRQLHPKWRRETPPLREPTKWRMYTYGHGSETRYRERNHTKRENAPPLPLSDGAPSLSKRCAGEQHERGRERNVTSAHLFFATTTLGLSTRRFCVEFRVIKELRRCRCNETTELTHEATKVNRKSPPVPVLRAHFQ